MVKCEHCKAPCIWKGGTHMPEHGCIVGYVPITNGDRIRGMGDIELANFLSGLTMCGCVNCPMYPEEDDDCVKNCNTAWQEWVKKESEDK